MSNVKIKCVGCGNSMPKARFDLGYKVCVSCSSVRPYGCIDVTYHKTGNTIKILDKKDAETMRKLTRRRGYGTMLK